MVVCPRTPSGSTVLESRQGQSTIGCAPADSGRLASRTCGERPPGTQEAGLGPEVPDLIANDEVRAFRKGYMLGMAVDTIVDPISQPFAEARARATCCRAAGGQSRTSLKPRTAGQQPEDTRSTAEIDDDVTQSERSRRSRWRTLSSACRPPGIGGVRRARGHHL